LSASLPEVLKDMQVELETYVVRNGVILPPSDYDGRRHLLKNKWQVLVRQMAGIIAVVLTALVTVLVALVYVLRHWWRRPLRKRQIA
jgi:hypothetical protein